MTFLRHRDAIRRASCLSGWVVMTAFAAVPIVGCTSSEETGAAQRAEHPQTEQTTATEFPASGSDSLIAPPSRTPGATERTARNPRVRRGQDTVHAATSRANKNATQRLPLVKPPNAMYTVQVGAFRRAPNALELQRSLKKEYGEQPVFSLFVEGEGMYKVTIGKFETLREASAYRKKLLADHPGTFNTCWVTYIERSR